jgi:hypothetical protein
VYTTAWLMIAPPPDGGCQFETPGSRERHVGAR